MLDESPFATVAAWQEAANNQDIASLLELSDPDIEIIGPRGSGYGHQVLREWLGRAGLGLETRRVFGRDGLFVVAQRGVWRSLETGEVNAERDIASLFRVEGKRVVQFSRYDDLNLALEAAGLSYSDELT